MKRISLSVIVSLAVISMLFVGVTRADVPAPPANQDLGIFDGIFKNMDEDDCRACHDDPSFPCSTSNVDRHHLYYGVELKDGECSVSGDICLSDANCDAGICEINGTACIIDDDCPEAGTGETCGEVCRGETAAPIIDADGDGVDDTNYGCLNCHGYTEIGEIITFIVVRDCTVCHIQAVGEGTVHHLTDVAQGRDSPLGDPDVGDCTPCHGTLVDDIGDDHIIPFYDPSLVTPVPSGGIGEPLNSRGNGAGACDYCHDDDELIPEDRLIWANNDTHHNTGLDRTETGAIIGEVCTWCHNWALPSPAYNIRVCEGCHGYESLHNIAADTDSVPICFYDPANPTECEVVVGAELPGYSHVGNDDDCWGCHGNYIPTAASGSGPVTPTLSAADGAVMTAGVDTAFTLTGASLTNLIGTFRWVSDVSLTAVDGSSVTLSPDSITKDSLTVTIPGTTGTGTYKLQAVKGTYAASNPLVINVKPEVRIDRVTNIGETYTITGTGFGDAPPAGAEDYLNVQINGGVADIISWNDSEIVASVSGYGASAEGDEITVNALFCDAGFEGSETCGDNVIEGAEVCDGTDLGGATCESLGYFEGVLTCLPDCSGYDESGCSNCIPDCNGNFDGDVDVDGSDAALFKADFGRNALNQPCETATPCNGDFDCDGDVDGSDSALFKADFGRGFGNNPCQPCTAECSYL